MKRLKIPAFFCIITFYHASLSFSADDPRLQVQNTFASHPQINFKLSDDSILVRKLSGQRVLSRKPITAAFLQNDVVLDSGETEKLGNIVGKVFADQDMLLQSARNASSAVGTLAAPPETQDEVVEFEDSYAVVRSTTVVVSNPGSFSQASPEYGAFLGAARPAQISKAQLEPEGTRGFEDFMRDELPNLPPDHPLRQAAEQGGEEAVLQAVAEGKGTFEIVDTLVVPKRAFPLLNGQLQKPTFRNGLLVYNELQPLTAVASPLTMIATIDTDAIEAAAEEERRQEAPPRRRVMKPVFQTSGTEAYRTEFLTGFTKGNSWEWERRWNYPSGFFRITLFGSYGIGMRIPLAVDGEISPSSITVKDTRDKGAEFTNKIRLSAVDADAGFYRRAGLAEDLIFDGEEAVLEVRFGWGCKFRALWVDVYHNPNSWDLDFGFKKNFTPPFGSDRTGFRIAIPSELTGTKLDLGVLSGEAQAGFSVGGRGDAELEHEAFLGRKRFGAKKLRFDDRGYQKIETDLPAAPDPAEVSEKSYGFVLSAPQYNLDLTITPEIKVSLTAGYSYFSRTFSTGWVPLNSMKMHLGKVAFNRHAGTRKWYRFDKGTKYFEMIAESARARIVPIISNYSKKYVHTRGTALGASDDRMSDWGKFELYPLENEEVAFRSSRTGKYVTVGASPDFPLYAGADEIGTAERFKMITVPPGVLAFLSKKSGRYVRAGVRQESFLTATSERISDWEKFRFTMEPTRDELIMQQVSTPSMTSVSAPTLSGGVKPVTYTAPKPKTMQVYSPTKPTQTSKPYSTVKPSKTVTVGSSQATNISSNLSKTIGTSSAVTVGTNRTATVGSLKNISVSSYQTKTVTSQTQSDE